MTSSSFSKKINEKNTIVLFPAIVSRSIGTRYSGIIHQQTDADLSEVSVA
jgi:hypothetical protein